MLVNSGGCKMLKPQRWRRFKDTISKDALCCGWLSPKTSWWTCISLVTKTQNTCIFWDIFLKKTKIVTPTTKKPNQKVQFCFLCFQTDISPTCRGSFWAKPLGADQRIYELSHGLPLSKQLGSPSIYKPSGQISIIPKPELKRFLGSGFPY